MTQFFPRHTLAELEPEPRFLGSKSTRYTLSYLSKTTLIAMQTVLILNCFTDLKKQNRVKEQTISIFRCNLELFFKNHNKKF